ncbi:MAG: hypothetical protein QXE19_04705 [Candidatus Bathyarchaeia archaeon]
MGLIFHNPYYCLYGYVPFYPIPMPIPIVPVAPVWCPLCPFCKNPLVWILPIGRWYCNRCRVYF